MHVISTLADLTPAQHAALYDAVRQQASELRRQAIDAAFAAAWRALRQLFSPRSTTVNTAPERPSSRLAARTSPP